MWCRQCQQDVPAIRSPGGGPECPRCRGRLGHAVDDVGIELESLERRPPVRTAPPAVDPADADLRRLGRKLRPAPAATFAVAPATPPAFEEFRDVESLPRLRPNHASGDDGPVLWGPTLALVAGLAALAGAVAALSAHAAGHASIEVWRWGLVAALGGEGLLVAGFAWTTARLWRNNRRLNRRVELIERQLGERQQAETRAPAEHWRHASGTRAFSSRAA